MCEHIAGEALDVLADEPCSLERELDAREI